MVLFSTDSRFLVTVIVVRVVHVLFFYLMTEKS